MVKKAVFTTDTHEIHIQSMGKEGWALNIFNIKHGVREIFESHVLRSYSTAYLYIENKYLKRVVA